jgi:hypothetical protein
VRTRHIRSLGAALSLAAALAAPPAAAQYGSDAVPAAPYGMDPVPDARFYRGRWNYYGSDPVPQSRTSDLGFRDDYGLDAIPEGYVPQADHWLDILPHHTLQVLTGSVEGGNAALQPPCE